MNVIPKAVPVSLILEKNFGNSVAAHTVRTDINGSEDVPAGRSAPVKKIPQVTRVDATEMEIARDGSVIVEVLPSTATSEIVVISSSLSMISDSTFEDDDAASSSSPAFEIENKNAKYKATTTLSAATSVEQNLKWKYR